MTSSGEELARRFDLSAPPELGPRFNVAPGQDVAIVREQSAGGGRVLELRRWGLVPSWARDPRVGARMINARRETLATRPAFREAFVRRRCLVPADGFYEWRRRGRTKQPYYLRLAEGGVFGFAGLYERWVGPDDAVVRSCTLVTTEANERVRAVHDRMPVILRPDDFATWLDPKAADRARLESLLAPCPAAWLELHPVSPRVNNPVNDGPDCIEPVVESQPSLF